MRRYVIPLIVIAVMLGFVLLESRATLVLVPTEQIIIAGTALDSTGVDTVPDSVRIITYKDGSELYDAWFNSEDVQAWLLNTHLVFSDQLQDIDSTGGDGFYVIAAGFYDDGDDLYTWQYVTLQVGTAIQDTTQAIWWTADAILDTVKTYDNATRFQKLIALMGDSLQAVLDSLQSRIAHLDADISSRSTLTASDNIGINWADVSNPTTSLNLSNTTISTSQAVASVSGAVGSVTGSVGSVTGAVGSVTGNVGGNLVGSVNLNNATGTLSDAQVDDITVTAGTVSDKSGYGLSTAERAALEDSIYANRADYRTDVTALTDSINAILDTLQLWDTKIALLTAIRDSLYAILDSLQLWDDNFAKLDATVSSRSTLTTSDNIGINWADISNQTTEVDLSATLISSTQTVASVSGAVGSVTGNVGGNVVGSINLDNATGTLANSQIDDDVDVNTKTITNDAITAASIATNAITDSKIANNAILSKHIGTGAITAAKVASDAIDEFWDEDTTGHATPNSYGWILADPSYVQGSGGDPWATALPGAYGAGTAGKIVGDNLDATISSRSGHSAADVWGVATRTITGDSYTPDVNVVSVGLDAITSSGIAADAITDAEIAAGAIGSSEIATNAIGPDEIASNAFGADEIASDAASEIGLATWNTLFATEFTNGTMGDSLNNASYVQGSSSLTAKDIWDLPFDTTFTAGSVGDSLTSPSYVQGQAASLMAVLAAIDSLTMRQGLKPGCWFHVERHFDRDSMWVGYTSGEEADTLLIQELIHTAGGGGAPPDDGNTLEP